MAAYYNEIDPYAAQWLRNLISAGHIAPGDVDERSISDVRPDDLKPYDQCHFFAGVGVWSAALRFVGWPDDARIWTGSCPCQPFSSAGEGLGFDDQRHLWPDFHYLITQRAPAVVIGEQVASKHAAAWLDHVSADMEGLGFAFGALAFPAAGVGAPHIRDRSYWLAHADGWNPSAERQQRSGQHGQQSQDDDVMRLGEPSRTRLQERVGFTGVSDGPSGPNARQAIERTGIYAGGLADTEGGGFGEFGGALGPGSFRHLDGGGGEPSPRAGPTNGYWRAVDWLACTDGKWRPVEPDTFPLAHGAKSRVGRLRAYGNAINLPQAVEFLRAAGLSDER